MLKDCIPDVKGESIDYEDGGAGIYENRSPPYVSKGNSVT